MFRGKLPLFDPRSAPEAPAELFTAWLLHALEAGVREPHAMTLSTAGADGNPTARTLILKNVSEQGRQFASDVDGVKSRDLKERPCATLTSYWSPLARQIRARARGHGECRAERGRLPGPGCGGQGRVAARAAEQSAR
ncbi:pyridoxamine 5'-phosphate oxidase family protein [Streptomyces sp. NPDC097727]|uniref:pyridoxamine 5'-phosphate oxidase family protein n=1 Tax=Streptomyces sp. NPDC097727 TaxID=3366092 RepID=UPI0038222A06